MIFDYIFLSNYRPFYGNQTIVFRAKNKNKNDLYNKNVVLIGGLNGHGKTSLINAINICLFGHRKFKNIHAYRHYLKESVNLRHIRENGNYGIIELAFTELYSNKKYALHVKFDKNGNEERKIYELDKNLEKIDDLNLTESDFYDFIDKKIPLDVSQFFIFDAERIREIVGYQEREDTAKAIQNIMSLNIYHQLSKDLENLFRKYAQEQSKIVKDEEVEKVRAEWEKANNSVELYEKNLKRTKELLVKAIFDRDQLIDEKRKQSIRKDKFKEEIYKNLGIYEKELEDIKSHLKNSKAKLNELILQPHIRELKQIIRDEKKVLEARNKLKVRLAPFNQFIDQLLEINLVPSLTKQQKEQLRYKGEIIWNSINKIPREIQNLANQTTIHDLSESDYRKIMNHNEYRSSDLKELISRKQELERLIKKNEADLIDAPETPDTSKIDAQIDEAKKRVWELKAEKRKALQNIDHYVQERNKKRNLYQELIKQQKEVGPLEKKLNIVSKVKEAVNKFINEVTTLKAQELKQEIEIIIEQLFRKEEFAKAEFDERTFTLSIFNEMGEKIEIDSRSEGEKQMIALAMIWALTKVSGSSFPFVIDTPLARLDSVHRTNLVHHYFNKLSDQVIILSTDTEITKDFYDELEPFIEISYTLEYNEENENTIIEKGYFFDREGLTWQR